MTDPRALVTRAELARIVRVSYRHIVTYAARWPALRRGHIRRGRCDLWTPESVEAHRLDELTGYQGSPRAWAANLARERAAARRTA